MTLLNHAYHLRFKTHPKPFLEIQRRSFLHFLNQGLNDEFRLYKTMTTKHKSNANHGFYFRFHCQHYRLKQPKRTVRQCLLRRKSYSVGLFMPIELFYKGRRVTILWFKMLDLPLMTKNGHFIMNGVTRVILNQVVRSPGVYFQKTPKAPGKTLFNADFIAQRGTWLRLEANEKEKKIWAKLKYCPKLPIVPFLRCFGLQPKVLNVYLDCLRNPRFTRQTGTSAQRGSSLDEALNGTDAKIFSKLIGLGLTRSRSAKKSRKKTQLHHVQPLNPLAYGITGQKESFNAFASTIPVNRLLSNQYFLEKIYRRFLKRKFWNPKTYDLSSNGRWKLNKTLGLRISLKQKTLTATDVLFGVLYLLQCVNGTKAFSDIDDLQNRNVKSVSTLLQNQLAAGLFQFEKTVMETLFDSGPTRKSKRFKSAAFASKTKKPVVIKAGYNAYQTEQQNTFEKLKYGIKLTPHYYKKNKKKKPHPLSDKAVLKAWLSRLNSREINRSFRTFFGTNPLSQFLDETNALAELTHKRRLSSLGLGGVTRETATMAVRSIHPTHYGRICPIETPEGQNAGLVNSLTTYGHLNANGLIETPFLKTYKGYVMTDQNPIGLSSVQEKSLNIASGDLPRTIYQFLPKQEVALRQYRDYKKLGREQVDIVAVTPVQMISVGTSLIPFLEHNDGNRALMGSNMQRQAVSTLHASRPIVGTGFESRTVANVGTSLQAESAGLIAYVDSQRINVYHPLRRHGSAFNADFQANTLMFSKTHKPIQGGHRFKPRSKTELNHDLNPINLHHNLVSTDSKTKSKTQRIRKQSGTTAKTKAKSKAQKIRRRICAKAKIKAKSKAQKIRKPFRMDDFQGQVLRQIMMTKLKKDPSLLNKTKTKTTSRGRKKQDYLETMYTTMPFFRAQSSLTMRLKKNHLKRDYVSIAKLVHFKGSTDQPFKANKRLSSKRLFESLLCLRFNRTTRKSTVPTKAEIKPLLTKKSMFGFLCYHTKSGLMTHQLNQAFQNRFDHSHVNDFRLIKPTLSHVTKHYDYGFVHELADSNLSLNQTNTCIFDASYARLDHAFSASNHEPDLEAMANNNQLVKRGSKHVPYIYQLKVRTAKANDYALTKFAHLKAKVFDFSALPINPFEVCYSHLSFLFQKPVNSPLNPFDKRPFQTKGQTKKWNCQTYFLEPINRSNQETYRIQRPRVKPGQWVQKGDLLAENVSSCHGELSVGQNLFVGYTPWEGYNFEDAVLISQRLVSNDIMTSLHIERYEIRTRDTIFGYEEITRKRLPKHHWDPSWLQLDESGIVKLGSWVKKGDTLVGRITPVQEKPFSNYERLLFSVLQRMDHGWRETSLVLSHGEGMVIHIEKSRRVVSEPDDASFSDAKDKIINRLKQPYAYPEKQIQHYLRKNRFKPNAKQTQSKSSDTEPVLSLDIQPNLRKVIYALKKAKKRGKFYAGSFAFSTYEAIFSFDKQPLTKPCQNENRVKAPYIRNPWFKTDQSRLKTFVNPNRPYDNLSKTFRKPLENASNRFAFKNRFEYDRVFVYVAHKRRIQIGDKISGRHGNKGIVSRILPSQDMPYLPDGTPLDVVLNPLGVPSRMNVGQIFECLLGLAGAYLNQNYKLQPFDEVYGCEASRSLVYSKLYEARLKTRQNWLFDPNFPGKVRLFDGRTGQCFEQPVTVGKAYILKLIHMVDEKIHARLTGPYSLITQQPLRGRAKNGGQRVGEMEVWALEGFGASYTLQEILTFKSDDVLGRNLALNSIQEATPFSYGVPECFRVLTRELNGLCLHLNIIRPRKHKPKPFLKR